METEQAGSDKTTARVLARLLGTFHNISYYAPEMKAFGDLGLREYWRAYMAYRAAPLGIVPASVVQSTFYNFAPSRVNSGLPSAWETTNPAEAIALRDQCITTALRRALADADVTNTDLATTAELAMAGVDGVESGARPLFAAHRDLPVAEDPLLRLWYAATLWREHRGDGHNIALSAAQIDGIECHVLLAAKGVGNKGIITKIRGWTPTEWDAAHERLAHRGLVTAEGQFTEAGRQLRADIETHTDALAAAPRLVIGAERSARLITMMEPLVGQLIESGSVPGRWPPKQVP